MKLAFVGTYPPQKCGIGTFTNNLIKAVAGNFGFSEPRPNLYVIAVNDSANGYGYPEEVAYVVNQNTQRDYVCAARFINHNKADVCIIQHEFGIYGGESGVYILSLAARIEIPLIVTFHTVLREPTHLQKTIVQELGKKSYKIIVMSKKAVRFLVDIYAIPEDKIEIIEHGVPVGKVFHRETVREKYNFTNRVALFTFGLLSRNKGIETVIEALPRVVEKHSNILYVVLGKTHPKVLKKNGEEYREYLLRLVREKGLENNVYFYKNFVPEEQLMEYLYAADIYITPYLNEAQITSGTLSYAVGAGTAVISTPYWHAVELLSDGRGVLFDFRNHVQLSNILLDLLGDRQKIENLREAAFEYGQRLKWPKIGARYIQTAKSAVEKFLYIPKKKITSLDPVLLPDFNLAHIKRLTDDTGIVQHAKFGIPNLKEGYCLDDNSRALLMTAMAYHIKNSSEALSLIPVYLSFVHYMQNDDGTFRNFLTFNRIYLDETGSEDCFGRTLWALGYLIQNPPDISYHDAAVDIFRKSMGAVSGLKFLRGMANSVIGLSYYIQKHPSDNKAEYYLKQLADKITGAYLKNSAKDWKWFEDELTYDNAMIPLSLLHAAEHFDNELYRKTAVESLLFLESVIHKDGYLKPVGSGGWYIKGGRCADFAQQSVDVMGAVLLMFQAYRLTGNYAFIEKMFNSFMWYLGRNELGIPVYDFESGGCADGLEDYGLNRNQGAESTLAYLVSHLTVQQAFELEHEYEK